MVFANLNKTYSSKITYLLLGINDMMLLSEVVSDEMLMVFNY